jgi:hypothetical protein
MGHACPVCGTPQADARHLADHLAFTAMLGDADHESYLDEHVPDWVDRDPESLGAALAEDAPDAEFPQVFAASGDAAGDEGHEHGDSHHEHGPPGEDGAAGRPRADVPDPELDEEAEEVLREAREMTARMRGEGEDSGATSDATDGGDAGDGTAGDDGEREE